MLWYSSKRVCFPAKSWNSALGVLLTFSSSPIFSCCTWLRQRYVWSRWVEKLIRPSFLLNTTSKWIWKLGAINSAMGILVSQESAYLLQRTLFQRLLSHTQTKFSFPNSGGRAHVCPCDRTARDYFHPLLKDDLGRGEQDSYGSCAKRSDQT